ncbi:MAG: hypothetical protein Q8M92_07965, partial [Candidatus Subteraquimicrobiales bacterium]|nr:hypothetical protein [Candidatus Subteraquimicrobiales bacterium]
MSTRERIGDILLRRGLIAEEQLMKALQIQKEQGEPLGKILIRTKTISEEQLAKVLAEQKNLPLICLAEYDID